MRALGIREMLARLRDRLRRDRLGRELEEELRFHRAMLERDARAAGVAEAKVIGDAARRFGNATYYREETRQMWSLGSLDDLVQDLRYALRTIRATPAFSLIVTVTLALGIGATTAMYTVVDSVLLRPLPYPEPTRLVAMLDVQDGGNEVSAASYQEYLDWRQRSDGVLSDVGAAFGSGEVLQTNDGAEQLMGVRVSSNLPTLLGVRVVLGRAFRADEDAATAAAVVMLSEPFWRSRFAGDPSIIGRSVTLTGTPHTVVGVFASGSNTVRPSAWSWAHRRLPDFWKPLRLDDKSSPPSLHWLDLIGQLKSGVDLDHARGRLLEIGKTIRRDRHSTHGIAIKPLAEAWFGDYRAPLRLLFVAVAVLLLIACVNTANLLLARTATRRREFAVRAALGAGRRRLLHLLAVESLLRAALGGACGVALAYFLVRGMRTWLAESVPRIADASIDGRVLAVAVLVTVLSGIVFGILPALHAGTTDAADDLRGGGRGIDGVMNDRLRRALMTAEVALSFMLLATAGLLTRSVVNLLDVPKGFDTANLIAGSTWLSPTRYPDSVSRKEFYDRLIDDLGTVYGASNVTLASDLPIAGGTYGDVGVEGRQYASGSEPTAEKRIVGNNYFQVLGARLVAGRLFEPTDVLGAPPVVVINQSLAKSLFPNENPIGKRAVFGWGITAGQTVIGVVADVRESALAARSTSAIYISSEQRPNYSMHFLVRTSAPEASVTSTFRSVLRKLDPTVPLVETQTMTDIVRASTQQQRMSMITLGAFAAAALLLAAVGLYGVISYSVAQRTHELGIRAALGASPGDLRRVVVGQAAGLIAAGIILGALGAFAARSLIATQLFGVAPTDPLTFSIAGSILATCALLAALMPMRRAARSDPMQALRAL